MCILFQIQKDVLHLLKRTIGQTTKAAATRTAILAQASSTNKLTTASTSSATSGAGKTINKRIPPYDFKARYHDLLEKHKVLKEKFEDKNEQLITLENLPEQLEDTQSQLITTQNDLKHTQTIKECLKGQVKSQREKIESLEASLNASKDELEKLTNVYNKLKKEHETETANFELRERSAELEENNAFLLEENTVCKEQLFRSNMERKELHNTVMDLRGNIRVFCRVRPPLDCEQDKQVRAGFYNC